MASLVGIPQRHAEQAAVRTWFEIGNATDSTAIADRSGEPGKRHYVTSIVATYRPNAGSKALLEIRESANPIWRVAIDNQFTLAFTPPLELPIGSNARLQLLAGGVGVEGHVSMVGFTV